MAQTLEAVFVHGDDQEREDYTPSGAAVVNGQVVAIGDRVGVCTDPEGIADGVLGSLATAGVFSMKKNTGVAFAVGSVPEWDDTNNYNVASGDVSSGTCVKAAASADTEVWVRLNHISADNRNLA